ncbi:hypothetical protein PG994_005066 [Apiospora phragmitis]|uniref:Secreted protein n=1 Tax=Apiospora phragmitis TaxID=2905665 RepID=A0ABR1VTL3_9PEZI
MWFTLFTLVLLTCHAAVSMAAPTFGGVGWWYSRCSSPSQVEASMNQENWVPSAVCLHGTCCSNQAEGPLCSYEACALNEEDAREAEARNANSLARRDITGVWPQPAVRRSTLDV